MVVGGAFKRPTLTPNQTCGPPENRSACLCGLTLKNEPPKRIKIGSFFRKDGRLRAGLRAPLGTLDHTSGELC
nr:hypothetical protein Hi04_10k_c5966_00006 [uncultured bacterium]